MSATRINRFTRYFLSPFGALGVISLLAVLYFLTQFIVNPYASTGLTGALALYCGVLTAIFFLLRYVFQELFGNKGAFITELILIVIVLALILFFRF